MTTIRNLTMRPLRVPLHGGRTLHLGPLKEGQIAPQDLEGPGVSRLIEAEEIEVIGAGGNPARADGGSSPHADTVGHHPDLTVKKRGDR